MGHSSIQVTADVYGHLVPGANIAWVDRLDHETTPQPNATQAQPSPKTGEVAPLALEGQLLEPEEDKLGERGRNRIRDNIEL